MAVKTERERERETDRQTDRQTETETETETGNRENAFSTDKQETKTR